MLTATLLGTHNNEKTIYLALKIIPLVNRLVKIIALSLFNIIVERNSNTTKKL